MGHSVLGITSAIERDVFTRATAAFNKGYNMAKVNFNSWESLCEMLPSDTTIERYPFTAPLGDMEKFIDERQIEKMSTMSVELKNIPYEKTVGISRVDMVDDKLGLYLPRIRSLGVVAGRFPEQQVAALLNDHMDGTNTSFSNGFDGVALFNTAHVWPVGGTPGSQSNLRTTGNAGKLDNTNGEANIKGAYESLKGFKDSEGNVIGCTPNLLYVSQSTWFSARKILESAGMNYGADDETEMGNKNVLNELGIKVVVNDWLTSGYWALCAVTEPDIRPVIFQNREDTWFSNQTTAASDGVFMRDEYLYGAYRRFAVAPGKWHYIVGGDGT